MNEGGTVLQNNYYPNELEKMTIVDYMNAMLTSKTLRFYMVIPKNSQQYLDEQKENIRDQRIEGAPMPWSEPVGSR